MPNIIFLEHDGTRHVAGVETGSSVMEGAVRNNIPGILAECGGACACATCHVIVEPEWVSRLAPPGATEKAMLGFVADVTDRSRLGCQITVGQELDGITVRLPETQ